MQESKRRNSRSGVKTEVHAITIYMQSDHYENTSSDKKLTNTKSKMCDTRFTIFDIEQYYDSKCQLDMEQYAFRGCKNINQK